MTNQVFTGWQTIKLSSRNYEFFVKECAEAKANGYYLVKASRKRQWPLFWQFKYKAKLRRDVLVDGAGDVVPYSKEEINRLTMKDIDSGTL